LVAPPTELFEFAEEGLLIYITLTLAHHSVYLVSVP